MPPCYVLLCAAPFYVRDSSCVLTMLGYPGPRYAALYVQVARADAEFLARMKIMDYSLLTGIHDRAKPAEEEQHQSPRRYSKL